MALDMDDGDWIPVWRKIRKSWVWEDPACLRFWLDLIMLANHGDGTFRFRGHMHHMKRGQVATTYKSLADRNGVSRVRVKSWLTLLEHGRSVVVQPRSFDSGSYTWTDTKADTGFLLLTIVNYPLRKVGQEIPTAESAAESAGLPTATRQRISEKTDSGIRVESDSGIRGHFSREDGGERPAKSTGLSAADSTGDFPGNRHIQEQQQQEEEDQTAAGSQRARVDVDARVEAPEPGRPEGDPHRAAVVVAGEPEQPTQKLGEEERSDLLSRPSRVRGAPLLIAVGVDDAIALSLAVQFPIHQVAGVAHHAQGKENPGGWARQALERGWGYAAPKAELDQLALLIRQDRAAMAAKFSAPPRPPSLPRLEGESDGAWLGRLLEAKRSQIGAQRKEAAR